MSVVIPMSPNDGGKFGPDDHPRGTWWRNVDADGRAWVSLTCPGCGRGVSIARGIPGDPGHSIREDGVVSPSVVCPHRCGWHVFIRLQGWTPITRPVAPIEEASARLRQLHDGGTIELSTDDDVTGRLLMGDGWEAFKAGVEPGVYELSVAAFVGYDGDMKPIKPTMASERGTGKFSVRVEGADVQTLIDAQNAGDVVALDCVGGDGAGTFKVVGCSVQTTETHPVGFFDVEAVDAPPAEAPEITSPGKRSPRRSE